MPAGTADGRRVRRPTGAVRHTTQDFASEAELVEGQHKYRSPQRFALELTFGRYRPDLDSKINGRRALYNEFVGGGHELLMRGAPDY